MAPRPAALTPVVARPEVLPAPVGEIVPSVALPAPDPLAGLDVIEAGPPREAAAAGPGDSAPSLPRAGAEVATDWLSPEGALRGDFGDLVDHIPQRPTAQAPVFPTPPAPWPSLGAAVAPGEGSGVTSPDAGTLADLDAGFEDVLGTATGPGSHGAAAAAGAPAQQEQETWTASTSDVATPVEASAIPGALDTTAAESEMWAESYGSEADAIHGELEPVAVDADAAPSSEAPEMPQPTDPASYLASEWPDRPAMDPSTLPTPVMPGPAVLPGWGATAGQVPPARRPTDPLFDAIPQEEDAFGWGKTPQEAPAVQASGGDDWAFAAAGTGGDLGKPVVTASSLSAAEALERVAAQLREGTLRADGFSPALGEAAALSAVLAALLGVDARWDVQR